MQKHESRLEFWRRARRAGKKPAAALQDVRERLAKGEPLYTYGRPQKLGMFRPAEYRRAPGAPVYIESAESAGFRFPGFSDELHQSIRHKGWYTDEFQDSTYRGAVLQIAARNGRARYVAAYHETDSGGFVIDPTQVFEADPGAELAMARRQIGAAYWRPDMDSESYWLEAAAESAAKDCASAADSMAEHAAENEREYNEAWQAGREFADLGEDIATTRREILGILKERRMVHDVTAPTLCGVIRARVESLLDDMREARAKRHELRDNAAGGRPDAAPGTYQARAWDLWCAFCDGANLEPAAARPPE